MTTIFVPVTNGENNQETLRFKFSPGKLFEFVQRQNLWFSGAAPTCKVNPRSAEFADVYLTVFTQRHFFEHAVFLEIAVSIQKATSQPGLPLSAGHRTLF